MRRQPLPLPGLLLCAIFLMAAGCDEKSGAQGDVWKGVSAERRKKAKRVYEVRCAPCHGETGAGDGPEAKKTNPPPRSFHDAKWQKAITNATIEKSILGGGAATGKSVVMPPNPDLRDRPKLVEALRAYVRSLGR